MLQLNERVKHLWYIRSALGSSISSAETGRRNAPGLMAVEAFVGPQIGLLQAFIATMRADAACIDPIPVAIKTVLYVIFVDHDAEVFR